MPTSCLKVQCNFKLYVLPFVMQTHAHTTQPLHGTYVYKHKVSYNADKGEGWEQRGRQKGGGLELMLVDPPCPQLRSTEEAFSIH